MALIDQPIINMLMVTFNTVLIFFSWYMCLF